MCLSAMSVASSPCVVATCWGGSAGFSHQMPAANPVGLGPSLWVGCDGRFWRIVDIVWRIWASFGGLLGFGLGGLGFSLGLQVGDLVHLLTALAIEAFRGFAFGLLSRLLFQARLLVLCLLCLVPAAILRKIDRTR